MAIRGLASETGTAEFASRIGNVRDRYTPANDLTWSNIGIGTYLGSTDDETDSLVINAIENAVDAGINVIDAAANYRRGRAEAAVGRALERVFANASVKRDEIILCTKAGYLPTPGDQFLAEYEGKDGITENDLVGGNHCLHPAYIEDRIGKSCEAMGVASIDVFYLHNPEAQLAHIPRQEFDKRLSAAFEVLETAVKDGRIGCYGLATWRAFRASPGEKDYISLAGVKNLANQVAGSADNGFRCVQLPLSIALPEAINRPTQWVGDATISAVAASRLLGIVPITSGSIAKAQFSDMNESVTKWLGADFVSDAQRALQFTRSASGVVSALVGMKSPGHLAENIKVFKTPPLSRSNFEVLFRSRPA